MHTPTRLTRRAALGATLSGAAALLPGVARAQSSAALPRPLRIGVLNDQSTVYADYQGRGSVLAAQMAAEDYAKAGGKRKVEVVGADHQNKPDIGAAIARRWVEQEGVDVVMDLPFDQMREWFGQWGQGATPEAADRTRWPVGGADFRETMYGMSWIPAGVSYTTDLAEPSRSELREVLDVA